MTIRLTRVCIKGDEHSKQPRNTVNLTEVSIGEDAPRVVTLAKFAGEELLRGSPCGPPPLRGNVLRSLRSLVELDRLKRREFESLSGQQTHGSPRKAKPANAGF